MLAQLLLDARVEVIVVLDVERDAVVLLVGARRLRAGEREASAAGQLAGHETAR